MMRNHEDQFWLNFSNHASGRIGMLSCCNNLLTKNKNGIININRETDVNFLAVADNDFIYQIFNHEHCIIYHDAQRSGIAAGGI